MKNWNWKQWTGFGLVCASLITLVVLHLVQPSVSYAFCEVMAACSFALGCLSTYLLKKRETTKE